jgi:hypothetical protein
MSGEWGTRLTALGLRIEELSGNSVAAALRYRSQRPYLSVPDSFALSLAKERAWPLLTGDSELRSLAIRENVECHGVLWLLDQLEEASAAGLQRMYDGLLSLAVHPRCRLPKREVTIRLERYRTGIRG